MDPTLVGIIGLIVLIVLLFSKMPVGFAMALVGFVGYTYIVSFEAGLRVLASDIFATWGSYNLTVVPLFIFMGQISYHSGISRRLYNTAYTLIGHLHGGLAMATILACAGFAAICGSTTASAATMTTVALPEMKRYKYDMGLATGTIAAGGSLGILIPPSVIFIIYGIMTEQSIGRLFAAGILPGLMLSAMFMITIYIVTRVNPELGPAGPKTTFKEKIASLPGTIEMLFIFILIMSGLFLGFFTPTEAGAAGAFITLTLAVIRRQLSWKKFFLAGNESVRTACMVMVIVAGATIFGHFLAVTQIPYLLAEWVAALPLPAWAIMTVIILIYLAGGCFMDSLGMILLTIPIFYPVVINLGYDPIWFGVTIVLICEMGVITPPVGVNVYVVNGVAKDVSLQTIFRGVMPMLLALIVCNFLLIFFPQIVLFLPNLMN
ncbi:TRAP transporter large permease [Desulfobacula sp.]|uniref:TRAP transporter large permease n=1 Tax=Desulfobacula sp. TaxID=2593537 RepID=UPI0026143749|nr:TRAP transporter large permease [Desulfobacula sp.]